MKEQASQTLFRFVSFRAPELIAPQKPLLRFMYKTIQDGDQRRVREISDGTYESRSTGLNVLNKDEIRALNEAYHDLGAWIQKNRRKFNFQELNDKLLAVAGNAGLINEEVVWLNLYYQYKTQEDHGARESLINLLIANHFLDKTKVAVSEEMSEKEALALYKEIAHARIVIPNDVIDTPETTIPNAGTSDFKRTSKKTEARIVSAISAYKLAQLKLAKGELEYLERQYRKAYDVAYENAFKTHNAAVKTLKDQYANTLAQEQETWYQGRKDQLKTIEEEEFLFSKISTTKFPDLPKFTFTFRAEIEETQSVQEMSSLLFNTVSRLTPIERVATFEEVYALFSKEEARLAELEIQNKELSHKKISLQGTILNEADRQFVEGRDICYTITLRSENTPVNDDGKWYWEYFIDLQGYNKEVNLQDISCTLTFSNGNQITDTIYITTYSDTAGETYLRTLRIFPQAGGIELEASEGVPALSGTITLQNGDVLTFDQVVNPFISISRDVLCNEMGNGDQNEDTTQEPFIPSGFGMRQLGIADYRRVEQNVHCYVEGEVSHIENVMAREIKEKSTRRLRRSENTTSSTSETEKEQLTDTSTTDRFEMQNEVAQVIAESTSIDAFANVNTRNEFVQFSAGGGFANNTSQEDSISQAVTQAQEITSIAMDRVVQKVKEERITKIVEEYEENNRHGFDNREGDQHIVGVYRWIDKVYKNQIYNYGKRLMYEFFIPDPSRLHKHALTDTIEGNQGTVLEEPIDPRTNGLMSAANLNRVNYRAWAAQYNAEVNAPADELINFSAAFSDNGASGNYLAEHKYPGGKNWTVEIPENYEVVHYTGKFGFTYIYSEFENTNGTVNIDRSSFLISENPNHNTINLTSSYDLYTRPIRNELGVSFHGGDVGGVAISLYLRARLTSEAYDAWQLTAFNAIMSAYEAKLAAYKEQFVAETEAATVLRASNPLFYRQIEQTVLRKNCVSYLIDRNESGERTYGKSGLYQGSTLENAEVKLNQRLDTYTSFATFLEQAIEWDIMSYNFYPFYWANRSKWTELYQYENDDPTFRKFMQAGMARVVVTVRPGFENAMMHYMATGNVWDGGELPVLDDPLYLSIVEELQQPLGIKEGEAWKTQVPTSLTILQADSLGLKVEKPLPCHCDDESDFQESDQTGCLSEITNETTIFTDLNTGASQKGLIQFSFRKLDGDGGNKTIGDLESEYSFPRQYRCQGETITIQRDAAWQATDTAALFYEALATQLSTITGVTAKQFTVTADPNTGSLLYGSLLFTVDFSKVTVFEFSKPGTTINHPLDTLTVDCDQEDVVITYGDVTTPQAYIEERLFDSGGDPITFQDVQGPMPASRFVVNTANEENTF